MKSAADSDLSRAVLKAKIVQRAVKDRGYRERLLVAPRQAAEAIAGKPLPPRMRVHVVEEQEDMIYLVLPAGPDAGPTTPGLAPQDPRVEIAVRAIRDAAFLRDLLVDPKRVLEREFEIILPDELQVIVL